MHSGVYLVHKPAGPSSFRRLKEVAPKDLRNCHGGTLDPFASGLLLVLVEPATQVFDLLHDIPKVYDATIRWGIETENGDPTGKIAASGKVEPTAAAIEQAMQSFIGWHEQIPPSTSAKRIDGERAYVRAHRGELLTLPASRVYLHSIQWLQHTLPHRSRVRLTVRGGYYIRSLVRDVGRMLGCFAHVEALHRIAIGPWRDPGGDAVERAEPLPWLPARLLSDDDGHDLKAGRSIEAGEIESASWKPPELFPAPTDLMRGIHRDRLSFILKRSGNRLITNRLLRGGIQL